jgi:Flp pilus assembly pilin Flp
MDERFLKDQQGLTLIEVVLYIAIVSAVLTAAIFFAWDVIGGQTKSYVITEVNQNSRFIIEKLSNDIRQATSLNTVSDTTLSLDLITGDTVIYEFNSEPDTLSRAFNSDDPIVIHSLVVDVSGIWEDLSSSQAAVVGLLLDVAYLAESGHSDWQSDISTSISFELNLQP